MLDRIFDAAKGMVINKISRGADDEEIADPLFENDLRRSAGVGTGQNDGEWVLRLRGLRAFGGRGLAGGDLAAGKAAIAFF